MNRTIKLLGLLSTAGLVGLGNLQFAPQANASGFTNFQKPEYIAKSQQFNPIYEGVLYCNDSSVKINIRSGPGTNYGVKYTSFEGLKVDVVSSSKGYDGYQWYEISYVDQILHQSDRGWVREDLLRIL